MGTLSEYYDVWLMMDIEMKVCYFQAAGIDFVSLLNFVVWWFAQS